MLEKFTLKTAWSYASNFTVDAMDKLLSESMEDIVLEKQPNCFYQYHDNGESATHFYCPACGHEWEEKNKYRYTSQEEQICPECGNAGRDHWSYALRYRHGKPYLTYIDRSNKYFIPFYVDKENGYVLFGMFEPSFSYIPEDVNVEECIKKGNFDFMHGKWIPDFSGTTTQKFVFMIDKGIRALGRNNLMPLESAGSLNFYTYARRGILVGSKKKELKEMLLRYGHTGDDLLKEICDRNKEILAMHKENRTSADRKKPGEKILEGYIPQEIPKERIEHACRQADIVATLKNNIDDIYSYVAYCPNCKKIFEIDNTKSNIIECPDCKRTIPFNGSFYSNSNSSDNKIVWFELMENTGFLVRREFSFKLKISVDKTVSEEFNENSLVVYTDKKPFYYKKESGMWKFISATQIEPDTYTTYIKMQSDEELIDIIRASSLKYSGVIAAWGLDREKEIEPFATKSREGYIFNWYKKPFLEKFVLSDLHNITNSIIRFNSDETNRMLDKDARSIIDILKVSKPVYDIARIEDFSFNSIKTCQALWEIDNMLNREKFKTMEGYRCGFAVIQSIAKDYGISFDKIIDYVNSCYNYQCIEPKETISIWRDYLNMASQMNYNLKDKSKKFPSSLKKEHDKASFAFKVVENETNRRKFIERSKENARYEYSNKDFFIRVPHEPEELVQEGTNLRHCAASYVNFVRDGQTVVVFIRKREMPDNSFFTMEINDNSIRQVKGFANQLPKEKKLLDFITAFAKNKNLSVCNF